MKPTISNEEIQSDRWDKARFMCDCYGFDVHEIAAGLAHFRMVNAEARAKSLAAQAANAPTAEVPPANLVHFNSVRQYWDASRQLWTKPEFVYIGRAMTHANLPASPFGNPFRIDKDNDDARADAIELYLNWIQLPAQSHLLQMVDSLRGKTMVCWCKPRRCHGEVLIELMRSKPSYAAVEPESADTSTAPDYQPALHMPTF